MKKSIVVLCFALLISSPSFLLAQVDLKTSSQEYFAKNDYDGFYDVCKAFIKKNKKSPAGYYYAALARYQQIVYWQKSKDWEGVYDKAAATKADIQDKLKLAQNYIKNDPTLACDIKFLKWENAKLDAQDNASALFDDCIVCLKGTKSSKEELSKIKGMADEISGLEDKNLARRIYQVFVEKLLASALPKEEIKARAQEFLDAGNSYLAKSLFEHYLEQFKDNKELQAKETVSVADQFIHTGFKEGADPIYAEDLYAKAATLSPVALNSGALYRRAYNLERLKEYEAAGAQYKNFVTNFSDDSLVKEVYFRLGVLSVYATGDDEAATAYFLKITEDAAKGPLTLSSFYQLGLLNQWNKENERAKGFYQALLDAAQGLGVDATKNELVLLTQERLKEIEEGRDIKYALKIFLDGVEKFRKERNPSFVVDCTAHPAKAPVNTPVKFMVTTSNPQTGCMTPSYSYEWSGELGNMPNIPNSPELTIGYADVGVKVTQVAVLGNQGVEGVAFEIVQIQEK